MKLVTFRTAAGPAAGYLEDGAAIACETGEAALSAVARLVAEGRDPAEWTRARGKAHDLADIDLLAPIPEPRRDVFCVGKNYRAHAAEFHSSGFDSTAKETVPSAPVIFTKATTSVIGPGAPIRSDLDPTASVDYEGELALVIGRRAFRVAKADAWDVVFGYTILNDVTSRELQKRHNQWVIGKGIDSFCPMGPTLVTADEVGDVTALRVETRINDEVRQSAPVSDLIFDIPTLIETLSATMTLLPGDIIATGTPAGVGIGFTPPKYLAPGDTVSIAIDRLGVLENPVA